MKIVSNLLFNRTNLYSANNTNNKINSNYASYPNLKPLPYDAVCFTGKNPKIILDAFETDYTTQLPILREKGEKLLKVVQECCDEVEGVSLDREYCEKSLNKSLDRYIQKFADSGAKPMDVIRTTLFIRDLYNFSIITRFIKALEKRGFYILPVPDKTSGKKILSWKPDFDIRLNDEEEKLVSPDEIKKLPQHLRSFVSKKQKSGYKDIQMRVVDASDLPKGQRTSKNLGQLVPEEIIFLFGENTAKAKTEESKYIYNITRNLDKMHILNLNLDVNVLYKIRGCIQLIGSILRSNISKPLYRNAEKLDVNPNETHILEDVNLDDIQCNILRANISDLRERTLRAYKKLLTLVKNPEYDIELEKMIKATHEYRVRPNKRVSDEEIKQKRSELIKKLKEHKTADINTIDKQLNDLNETIEKYRIKDSGEKAELKAQIAQLDKTIGEILSSGTTLGEEDVARMRQIQVQKNELTTKLQELSSKPQ